MRQVVGLWLAAAMAWGGLPAAVAAAGLAPLSGAGPLPPPPWRFAALPQQTLPATRFALVELDGRRALRIDAAGSYGNLVHPIDAADAADAGTLAWRWRVDQPVTGADLRRKEGDDTAVKVCAMFDLPLDALPFWERQKMRLARRLSGQALPAATLCYVWDPALPADAVLRNAYSPRLRWIVLRGRATPLAGWQAERRDLRADFLRAFGDEATRPPPLVAIALGADADNTGGQSTAYVADLTLTR